MAEVQKYTNPMFGELRIVEVDGEPWFIASDVAKALGYSESAAMTRRLDDEDRDTLHNPQGIETKNPNVAIINESGLYAAILSSRLDSAKQFKRWVTSEVLPALRKHGVYATPAALELSPDELMARAVLAAQATIDRIAAERDAAQAQVAELEPAAKFGNALSASDGTLGLQEFGKVLAAKGYPTGPNKLGAQLQSAGVMFQRNGRGARLPRQEYLNRGWFDAQVTLVQLAGFTKERVAYRYTVKGQQAVIDLFDAGVLV